MLNPHGFAGDPNFVLCKTCILNFKCQLFQFLRTFTCHIKRIFPYFVPCGRNKFWHAEIFGKRFRLLKRLFYLVIENFLAFKFATFHGLPRQQICQVVLQVNYSSRIASNKFRFGQEIDKVVTQRKSLFLPAQC